MSSTSTSLDRSIAAIPFSLQSQVHWQIWKMAGCPEGDHDWGRTHRDENPIRRDEAILIVAHRAFDTLEESKGCKVAEKIWKYSGEPNTSDPEWGKHHAKDPDKLRILLRCLCELEAEDVEDRMLDPVEIGFPHPYTEEEVELKEIAKLFLNHQEATAIERFKSAVRKGTLSERMREKLHEHYWDMSGKPFEPFYGQKFEQRTGDSSFKATVIVDFVRKGFHHDDRAIHETYEQLQAWTKEIDYESVSREGRAPDVRHINQWNIVPYDATRVHLSGGKYINASQVFEGKYILTQTPVIPEDVSTGAASSPTHTADIFWQMVDEKNVERIVMLNGERRVPYFVYFPMEKGEKRTFGERTLECLSHTKYTFHVLGEYECSSISHRTFLLTSPTCKGRVVHHIKANTWRDFTPGDEATILKIIAILESTPRNGPIVVHCRAGVGRTGQFLLISELLEKAKAGSPYSVIDCLKELRDPATGRCPSMVQGYGQYQKAEAILRNAWPPKSEPLRSDDMETL
jgi:protein tyrosine phosphatase